MNFNHPKSLGFAENRSCLDSSSSFEVVWSRLVLSAVVRRRPDSSGFVRIRPELFGVIRSRSAASEVVRSRPKSCRVGAVVTRLEFRFQTNFNPTPGETSCSQLAGVGIGLTIVGVKSDSWECSREHITTPQTVPHRHSTLQTVVNAR